MPTKVKIYTHLWYAEGAEDAARYGTAIFPNPRVDRVTPSAPNTLKRRASTFQPVRRSSEYWP